MKHYFTLLILIITLVSFQSKASHYMGSEMTYTRVNATTINVKLKLYRDCSGIGFCGCPAGPLNNSCSVNVTLYGRSSTCNNTNLGTSALSIVPGAGVVDVIQLCSQAGATNCSNCGTKTPGSFNPAAEIYTFQGNISLASVPASCNTLAVGFSECCRSFLITSIQNPSSQNFYTELVFDKRYSNTSPSFINKPLASAYAGKDVYYNVGGFDPDGDSISYEMVSILSAPNVNATYSAPYSAQVPFPYLGAPSQNNNYPFGISFNNATGDIRFRPLGSFMAPISIMIKEWRKDSTNIWVNISGVRREMLLMTRNSVLNNSLPWIRTYDLNTQSTVTQPLLNYTINAGQQLCFVAVASDSTDTTNLTWNAPPDLTTLGADLIPMYTPSTRALNGPKKDSMLFCWIPPVSAYRKAPYFMTFTASDANCPLPGTFTKGITIKVDSSNGIFTPLIPPNQMSVSNNTGNGISLNWTKGSGTNSLVIARANNANFTPPTNGIAYTANSVFGQGTQLMKTAGSYVVYNGTGSTVNITGLTPGTTYFFRVYSFNGTGSSTNYNRGFYTSTSTQTLPVELKEFSVILNEKGEAELKWTTATEINNSHFEVERSFDSENSFIKIGKVKGLGNSNLLKSYQYFDGLNLMDISATTIYYRLKQVDYDGKFEYSPVVSLNLNETKNGETIVVNPNPFKDEIKISGVRELSSLKLYDPSGKEIMSKVLSGSADGSYMIKINTSEKGMFVLKINNESFKLLRD